MEQESETRDMRQIAMMPVVYQIPNMEEVKVKSDLRYTAFMKDYLKPAVE